MVECVVANRSGWEAVIAQADARSSFQVQAFGRVGHARIAGVIDETFAVPNATLATEQLILDVGRVERINSFGVGRWLKLVSTRPAETVAIWVIHAPPVLVDQLNLVSQFDGAAEVLSVLAPYECPGCGPERLSLIDMTALATRLAIDAGKAPERSCPNCRQRMLFSEDPTEYFRFFRSIPQPSPPPIVEHFLRFLKMPDGCDSTEPFKLLSGNVTYYQLRGKVMPNLNVRRMAAGLEGQVVFDFARVCAVVPGAQERLNALIEQSAAAAEVLVSRAPVAVLDVLSSSVPVRLASVLLEGQCTICGERRPHCLPASEHLEDRQRGPLPDRPCPVCGGPSLILGADVAGFLGRHSSASIPPALKVLETRALAYLLDEAVAARLVRVPATVHAGTCKLCGDNHEAGQCPTFSRDPGLAGHTRTQDVPRPDLDAEPVIGRMVGNYRLTRLLGEGASACVYLAEHSVIGSQVAVKILRHRLTRDASAVARFIKEARMTSTVIHDNVVQVLDINTTDHDMLCIIMEYLDGETLTKACARRIVPYEESAPLLLQICDALATAHRHGIVHRDLKPDNIHLLKRAGRLQVKIVDFGIARRETLSDGEQHTQAGTILGTPQYMSPEQAFTLTADGRADVYSLGVIMFQLATGRLPFEQEDFRALLTAHCMETPPRPRSINPQIEPGYEQVILRTLAKDPKDRYQTMSELGRAIAHARLEGQVPELPPPAQPEPAEAPVVPGPAMRRHPRYPVAVSVEVELPALSAAAPAIREQMTMVDISMSGAWLRSRQSVPEVFTRVVLHPAIPGAHPLVGEVTRTSRSEDPELPTVMLGFGVNFIAVEDAAAQEQTIQAILAVTSEPASGTPTTELEFGRFLTRVEATPEDDHYALLAIPLYANFPSVRNACAHLARVLDSPHLQSLGPEGVARANRIRERFCKAEEVLVEPARRAAYDASNGNFVGIARCLAFGLRIDVLRQLRADFLVERPDLTELMQPVRRRLGQIRDAQDGPGLLEGLTIALRLDPLDLELQTEYWEVRRKLKPELDHRPLPAVRPELLERAP